MSDRFFDTLLVHYHEIGLKGKNRSFFEKKLADNLARALEGLGALRPRRITGRIVAPLEGDDASWMAIERVVARTCGVRYFARARTLGLDPAELESSVVGHLAGRTFGTFGVRANRPNKAFGLTSAEIGIRLGRAVQMATGAAVDLDDPEVPVCVEVLTDRILVHFGKIPGPGGLPVGASGRVVCLLSGGIDSPVAAWRMMKRGCAVHLVHFHSFPFTSAASQEKVEDLARVLAGCHAPVPLTMVPFSGVQERIVTGAPPRCRVILYRRFMARIAERIALEAGALALVTGESLGQVASQTLANLRAIEAAVSLPILRPLIAMDKEEIVAEAKRLGTFDISIGPHDDCCIFLMPERPLTKATPAEMDDAESSLPVEEMVAGALADAERGVLE